ncbi:hypothetical protein AYJ08_21995 [Brevibacillus sp. SKDU10]|nr:hypothetical protein AYJ08_21995 [Brevibacillus sp. SKDU10]
MIIHVNKPLPFDKGLLSHGENYLFAPYIVYRINERGSPFLEFKSKGEKIVITKRKKQAPILSSKKGRFLFWQLRLPNLI